MKFPATPLIISCKIVTYFIIRIYLIGYVQKKKTTRQQTANIKNRTCMRLKKKFHYKFRQKFNKSNMFLIDFSFLNNFIFGKEKKQCKCVYK